MLHIIYPYRQRDLKRIRLSLQSLAVQSIQTFKVHFVDYGSAPIHAKSVETLIAEFSFASYSYLYTQHQPWNKSKALNSAIREINSGYIFVADVDMIFHPNFVETAVELTKANEVWFFKVGFLDEKESSQDKAFKSYNIKFTSNEDATGLTLCPVEGAKAIHGFDEFYHFWGSEDTDFHMRLANAGYTVNFYDEQILLLHQYHIIYRNKETEVLTEELQLSNIVQFNHHYLSKATSNESVKVNSSGWGKVQSQKDFNDLNDSSTSAQKTIGLNKHEIDYFLFQELPNIQGLCHFVFRLNAKETSVKKKVKAVLKKNKNQLYSLKEVNDMLLLHIINFYHHYPYRFLVSKDLNNIQFSIKK